MSEKTIRFPFVRSGMSLAVNIYNPDLTFAAAGVALNEVGSTGVYNGTTSLDGKYLFELVDTDNSSEPIEHVPRVRTLGSDAAYVVLTGLDLGAATGGAISPTEPADSDEFATGWLICYDEGGNREDGVDITIQLVSGPGVAGYALDTKPRTGTSATVDGVAGYVEFTGLRRGATYSISRAPVVSNETLPSTGELVFNNQVLQVASTGSFIVPDNRPEAANTPSFAIDEVIGRDE